MSTISVGCAVVRLRLYMVILRYCTSQLKISSRIQRPLRAENRCCKNWVLTSDLILKSLQINLKEFASHVRER